MRISNTNTLKLGTFVVVGLLVFILGIYYLGKQQNLFSTSITVMSEFNDVKGLQVGNSVRFLGINAGSISDITITNDTVVLVEMEINKKLSQYIRGDSKVEIQNEGVMGTKIITIHPGSTDAEPIAENQVLPSSKSMSIEEIFGALEGTVEYSTEAARNLMEVTEKIKNGEGDLGKFINDNTLKKSFDKLGRNLMEITQDAKEIVDKANNGDSDIARLLNEDNITSGVDEILADADTISESVKASSKEIKQALNKINQGDGIIHKALYDSSFAEDIDTTVVKIKEGVDDIIEVSDAIEDSWFLNLFSGNKEKRKERRRNRNN